MAWITLFLAGLLEIGWAVGLKYTHGFTRLVPTLFTVTCMAASLGLLGLALRALPLGTAYAIWTGIGTVGTALLGILLFGEAATAARLAWVDGRSRTRSFIGWARTSQQVIVRVRDIEGRRIDMRFPLADARGTIDQAIAICNGAAPPPDSGTVTLPGT